MDFYLIFCVALRHKYKFRDYIQRVKNRMVLVFKDVQPCLWEITLLYSGYLLLGTQMLSTFIGTWPVSWFYVTTLSGDSTSQPRYILTLVRCYERAFSGPAPPWFYVSINWADTKRMLLLQVLANNGNLQQNKRLTVDSNRLSSIIRFMPLVCVEEYSTLFPSDTT